MPESAAALSKDPQGSGPLDRILRHAEEVFGDSETAEKWLRAPNLATDGLPPIALVNSESQDGYLRVRTLLDRIDYGVLA